MILVICSLAVSINAGGIPVLINADTHGKVKCESATRYLVDFSEGVSTYKLLGKPSDYAEVLIEKDKCVKLSGTKEEKNVFSPTRSWPRSGII